MSTTLPSRRQFLAHVGKGTLVATIGPALASELGLASASIAADAPPALNFGDLEPLVRFMEETPVKQLQSAMAERLKSGTGLKKLLTAGVLANARNFGGEDYIGFHTLMALSPALKMANLMPQGQAALPVFKVLYRNTSRIQDHGGCAAAVLRPVDGNAASSSPEQLLATVRSKDITAADSLFVAMVKQDAETAFNALLHVVQENTEVHRTVLPYRAWELLDIVGHEHASTLLRQSLHYCVNAEKYRRPEWDEHGKVLVRLLDEHKLMGREPGKRTMDDAALDALSKAIFTGSPTDASGAVASALAEGFDPAAVGEALSLAANQLVLRDPGRPAAWESKGKPAGSVHGDSVGVHASDSINAWRNLSRVSRGRNVYACLILGAWQVAEDRVNRVDLATCEALPTRYHVNELKDVKEAGKLIAALDEAVQGNMQGHAVAAVQHMGDLGLAESAVFDLLLKYAVSEDGALHAEKYYHTVWSDFHSTRPAFRWRHLAALARVTASEFGRPAPGQAEARELLHVT